MTRPIKLVCVGDGAVGKTCLMIVYATNRYPPKYIPTVFDNYVVVVDAPNEPIELSLWDTAGQEEYDQLRKLSYQDADVVVICFSIVSRTSFENVKNKWIPEVVNYSPRSSYLLCGTKSDLKEDPTTVAEFQVKGDSIITEIEGEELSRKLGAYKYIECSAISGYNVKKLFDAAIISVLYPPKSKRKKRCVVM